MNSVFEYLESKRIPYTKYCHSAVFTTEDFLDCDIKEDYLENKNLFFRNRKGDKHFLVSLSAEKKLDIRELAQQLGEKGLSFASKERLEKYLGLTPGSVSPFGLIHDAGSKVAYFIDKDLLGRSHVGFHPNINTQTIILKTTDFINYVQSLENSFEKVTL